MPTNYHTLLLIHREDIGLFPCLLQPPPLRSRQCHKLHLRQTLRPRLTTSMPSGILPDNIVSGKRVDAGQRSDKKIGTGFGDKKMTERSNNTSNSLSQTDRLNNAASFFQALPPSRLNHTDMPLRQTNNSKERSPIFGRGNILNQYAC